MELSLFTEEQTREPANILPSNSDNPSNYEALIEPWTNSNRITNKTLPLKKEEPNRAIEKACSERKKTIDERIEEMYRKYSKDGLLNNRQNNQVNSREVYRQMLKEFQKAQEFKQIGEKREKPQLEIAAEPLNVEITNQNTNSNVCAYDYQEVQTRPSPKKAKLDEKCVNKFQRMLKIRDKVRKKNSVAVSKLKEKYLSEYTPAWQYSNRQSEVEFTTQADREKARMKIRIRNQSKSKNTLDLPSPKQQFKVVGVYSNALEYAIKRNNNYSSNTMRVSKYNSLQLNQTYYSFRH